MVESLPRDVPPLPPPSNPCKSIIVNKSETKSNLRVPPSHHIALLNTRNLVLPTRQKESSDWFAYQNLKTCLKISQTHAVSARLTCTDFESGLNPLTTVRS